jgi:hypothetical protein
MPKYEKVGTAFLKFNFMKKIICLLAFFFAMMEASQAQQVISELEINGTPRKCFNISHQNGRSRRLTIWQGDGAAGMDAIGTNKLLLGYDESMTLVVGGTASSNGWNTNSDFRFKTNILPLTSSLSSVLALKPVTYFYKSTEFKRRWFGTEKQIGFIAQDVQKLYPELVSTDTEGYLSLDYAKLTPVLVKALQEQQIIIEEMKKQLEALKQQTAEMKASLDELNKKDTATVSTQN